MMVINKFNKTIEDSNLEFNKPNIRNNKNINSSRRLSLVSVGTTIFLGCVND